MESLDAGFTTPHYMLITAAGVVVSLFLRYVSLERMRDPDCGTSRDASMLKSLSLPFHDGAPTISQNILQCKKK